MLGVRIPDGCRLLVLIVFTGILGATLARQQGLSILQKIQTEMQHGRPPALEMVEGAMIVIGGMVLLYSRNYNRWLGLCSFDSGN